MHAHALPPAFSSHQSPSKRVPDLSMQEGESTSSKQPVALSWEKLGHGCQRSGGGFFMQEMEEHVLQQSPASSAMDDHPVSVNEDPDALREASAKGIGFSATNYGEVGVDDDGGLTFTASDTGCGNGHESTPHRSEARQLYTLRRNPKPSKRFEDQELLMEMRAAGGARICSKEHQCSECGKEFVSSRALAGHMRCHPERMWRGAVHSTKRKIFPDSKPKRPQSSSSSQLHDYSPCQSQNQIPKFDAGSQSDGGESIEAAYMNGAFKPKFDGENESSDGESIEAAYMNAEFKSKFGSDNQSDGESMEAASLKEGLKSNCRNWKTGKRSRRSHQTERPLQADPDLRNGLKSQPTTDMVKENKDIADWLVMLAYAGKIQEHQSADKEATHLGLSECERSKPKALGSKDGGEQSKGVTEWNQPIKFPQEWRQENYRPAEQKEGMQLDPSQVEVKIQIECNICKRVFKSRQALGGHRASHKKVKGCFARGHDSERDLHNPKEALMVEDIPNHRDPNFWIHAQRIAIDNEDEIGRSKHMSKTKSNTIPRIKPHECSICHKIFQSGQALGGHKRCHWGGTASPPETSLKQDQPLERSEKDRIGNEQQLDHHLVAPDNTIPDPHMASTSTHMHLLKTKSRSNHLGMGDHHPLRMTPLADATHHHRESRASSKNRPLIVIPAGCDEKETASQGMATATEMSMVDAPTDPLAFTPWYVQQNVSDQVSSSITNVSNHQRKHASTMGSVAGLTPISA